ncbi:maltoporin [Aquabacterium humicola]|uniref:maltoporin n=1 Tax=Aquabacterium humicola TaxID=3237377 RepID=UPI002542909A|nr:carbohydrate porin [Rubrivivax pictus]
MKNRNRALAARTAAAAALGLIGAGAAHALDYSGYFRAGPGLASQDASRACYGLNGGSSGMKYRLGNECDFYGEFVLSQPFSKDGIEYRATLMVNHWTPATEPAGGKGFDQNLHVEQMFAEAKGFDIAPQATFWIGKERGRRVDVHIVDTFFTEMTGVGAGFKGQPLGAGKFGVAYYRTDSDAARPGNRVNLEYVGLPANADGQLNFFVTATKGDFADGKSGFGLTLRHDQGKLFGTGLSNTLWLQFAQGSAGLNSNFGDLTAGSAAKSWRIVESFNGQSGALGGQAMLLLASEKDRSGKKTDSSSLGGRVSYALSRNFKMVAELGYSQFKPQGGQTAKLTKLTIAPTLSIGPDFWSRPEFRLYATSAKWNRAAGNVTGQDAFANRTSGTSYGAQVEWWF